MSRLIECTDEDVVNKLRDATAVQSPDVIGDAPMTRRSAMLRKELGSRTSTCTHDSYVLLS